METKREEFNTIRKYLPTVLGSICCSCGSTDMIQYHHILPLAAGGDNRLTNIVPICAECHSKIHGQKPLTKYSEKTGRPKSVPTDDYKITLRKYIIGELDSEETRIKLEIKNGARIAEQWYYKNYIQELGIKKIIRTGNKRGSSAIILFEDGRIEEYRNGDLIKTRRKYAEA